MERIGTDEIAVLVAARGAQTRSIRLKQAGEWREILWQGGPDWSQSAPLLFPINGRAQGDLVAVGAHQARMTIHGFAQDLEFVCTARGLDFCRHEAGATAQTLLIYPFEFNIIIEHRVRGACVVISAFVENKSADEMPFSLGFHPGFRWPLEGASGPHVVTLESGGAPEALALAGGLLTGEVLPSPFERGVLPVTETVFAPDSSIVLKEAGALRYGTAEQGLRISAQNLPHLVLWHPAGAEFLCIEPWHGLPARIGAGPQMTDRPESLRLGAGEIARFSLKIEGFCGAH